LRWYCYSWLQPSWAVSQSKKKPSEAKESSTPKAFQVPEVKKGEPIGWAQHQYDLKEWKARTKPDTAPWFVAHGRPMAHRLGH
jgi:hypothetical protein